MFLVNQGQHGMVPEIGDMTDRSTPSHPHALVRYESGEVEQVCIEEAYGLEAYLQILDMDCEILSRLIAEQKLPELAFQRAALDGTPWELDVTGIKVPQLGSISWVGRYENVPVYQSYLVVFAARIARKLRSAFHHIREWRPPSLPFANHLAEFTRLVVDRDSLPDAGNTRRFLNLTAFVPIKLGEPLSGMRVPMLSPYGLSAMVRPGALVVNDSSERTHALEIIDGMRKGLVDALIVTDGRGRVSSVRPLVDCTTGERLRGNVETETRWPRITVVTVSYNQCRFLRECLESVLDQDYPNLDFVVIDGDSTDGSREILEAYRHRLSHLVIEPDRGQSHALNKGFMLASGDVMTWLCSDDKMEPGSLASVALIYQKTACDMVVGGCRVIDGDGRTKHIHHSGFITGLSSPLSFGDLASFTSTWQSGLYFYQPEVFFTRDLWMRAGSHVKEHLHYAMDYEMFLRFALAGAHLFAVEQVLASSRQHEDQKTRHELPMYLPTVARILKDFRRKLGSLAES